MFTREGFWRGSDRNTEAIVHVESEPRFEGSAQHAFESSGDPLENHDTEMLPCPAEQYPMIGEPKTLLRKRQVKQLLSTTERILELGAITSGSDINLATFSDSCVDLTEVVGRHGIDIADQVSCAAGWNPLSSSGRHRFWHIHCTLTPKLIIYRFPVAVQQWLAIHSQFLLICLFKHVSGRLEIRFGYI